MRGGEGISKEPKERVGALWIAFGEGGVDDYMGKAHLLVKAYQLLLGMEGFIGD